MSAVVSTLEKAARSAWLYGCEWRMFTRCTGCGEMKKCAGKTRARMRCLPCFDEGVVS